MNIEDLSNENFCLSYELEILAGIVCLGQLERWVPGFTNPNTDKEHNARYTWIQEFVSNKRVLDIACGSGRGSFLLAEKGKAKSVIGCDLDSKTIKYASIRNKHPKVNFIVANAETYSDNMQYDIITSFETIEHFQNVEIFLLNIKKLLAKDGCFFVSTPISSVGINTQPYNKFHNTEWGFRTFQELITKHFKIDEIFVQLYPYKFSKIEKAINKFILNRKHKYNLDLKPVLWDSKTMPLKYLGSKYSGYQILKCTK